MPLQNIYDKKLKPSKWPTQKGTGGRAKLKLQAHEREEKERKQHEYAKEAGV